MLSALTEMLDRVEEDEDQAFSPFDVLPDSEFLRRAAHRDDSVGSAVLNPSDVSLLQFIEQSRMFNVCLFNLF